MRIDFVITWVDGNDIEWQKEKARCTGKELGDDNTKRYRDWEFLRYWFRSVEKCAPWVGKIHFVTYGHLPSWLNISNPKLNIVKHTDFIPQKYLPTFSCRPIELNLHRIPGLSEHFVYFNDDMFLMQPAKKTDFFVKGLPCDTAVLEASHILGEDMSDNILMPESYDTSKIMNMVPLNRNFSKRKCVLHNLFKWYNPKYGKRMLKTVCCIPWKYFTGFRSEHMPYSLMKRTFEEVWDKETALLDRACSNRVRNSTDVSSRLMSFWQMAKGEFYPRSVKTGRYFGVCNDKSKIRTVSNVIKNRKYKLICLNDEYSGDDFDGVKKKINLSFEKAFPEKSSFEL